MAEPSALQGEAPDKQCYTALWWRQGQAGITHCHSQRAMYSQALDERLASESAVIWRDVGFRQEASGGLLAEHPEAAVILAEVPYDLAEALVDELKERFYTRRRESAGRVGPATHPEAVTQRLLRSVCYPTPDFLPRQLPKCVIIWRGLPV